MLLLLLSTLAFILVISKSRPSQLHSLLPSWATEEFLFILLKNSKHFSTIMAPKRKFAAYKVESMATENSNEMSVLDLPDLALERVLEKLSPSGLCNMSAVCSDLRDRCHNDYLWEKHMREKWGKVIGPAARREWDWYLAMRKTSSSSSVLGRSGRSVKRKRWISSLSRVWPLSWLKFRFDSSTSPTTPLPDHSIMSWYLTLQSGKFWFPAQVYNREHGHVGFMLSCYDAELCYDCNTDTFQARYPPHGRRTMVIEEGVQWERIRSPPSDTPAHDLHASDCLHDLYPGNHIEIQWRRNKEFPYGWWYGTVGHLESCDGNEHFCRCHKSDNVVLEFNQYQPGSRWRQKTINRNSHREEGNETDGFYGGIRKLCTAEEISTWKQLRSVEVLE